MFVHNLDPVIFTVAGLSVRWYGLVYVLGFIGAYYALRRLGRLSSKQADALTFWLVLGVMVGARTFFFVFYRPDLFWSLSPVPFATSVSVPSLLALWQGGMSFHGGLLGAGIAAYLWTRKSDISFWRVADIGALVAAFALALGRVANFINAEIYGVKTSLPWCVRFPGIDGCRHPAQLYAAAKDLLIGGALVWLWRRGTFKDGFIFWSFAMMYGILRFLVNFVRDDPVIALGWVKMGHLLTIVLMLVAGYMLYSRHRDDLTKVYKALIGD